MFSVCGKKKKKKEEDAPDWWMVRKGLRVIPHHFIFIVKTKLTLTFSLHIPPSLPPSFPNLTSCCQMPRPSNTHLFVLLPSSKHCLPVPFLRPPLLAAASSVTPDELIKTKTSANYASRKSQENRGESVFSFTTSWGSAGTASDPGHWIDPTERFFI